MDAASLRIGIAIAYAWDRRDGTGSAQTIGGSCSNQEQLHSSGSSEHSCGSSAVGHYDAGSNSYGGSGNSSFGRSLVSSA